VGQSYHAAAVRRYAVRLQHYRKRKYYLA
jgi:hypothetical protein